MNDVFKTIGIDTLIIDKKTGEIKESVGRIVLEKQIAKHPALRTYVEYKKGKKILGAYGVKFLRHVNPQTGRIHSSYSQLKKTGRTGSSNPNLQNIPGLASFREAFATESVMIGADFSNQEQRILAAFSGDEAMLKVFSSGLDLHSAIAKQAFKLPELPSKDSLHRKYAKSIGFLTAYGGGAKKLSEQFGIPLKDAKELINSYFTNFPTLKEYYEEVGRLARERGYILVNNVTKRRVGLLEVEKYI